MKRLLMIIAAAAFLAAGCSQTANKTPGALVKVTGTPTPVEPTEVPKLTDAAPAPVEPTEAPKLTDVPTTPLTPPESTEPTATVVPETPTPVEPAESPLDKYARVRAETVAKADYYETMDNRALDTWCYWPNTTHTRPKTFEWFKLSDYNSYCANDNVPAGDKVIYLTFDCGVESSVVGKMLDTLKDHNAKAAFFVTVDFMKHCPEQTKRMADEGHLVCNHTVSHRDLKTYSVDKIVEEVMGCSEYYYNLTGREIAPFFRCPTGVYTPKLLQIYSDLGFETVFWTIAYGDYDMNKQPEYGYVQKYFYDHHHNGAIALMHAASTSNARELDEVLNLLEDEGYRFGSLNEIKNTPNN